MTVVDLLSLLEAKGISLALNGDQLAVRGDKKALADAGLVDLLRQKKAELIAFLQQGGQTTGLGGRVAVPPNGIPSDGSAERITPEMVTLAALTQDEIDALVAQVAGGTPNIQDIYPLAPLQEGMLFHHLVDPEHDAYVEAGLIAAPSRERLDSLLAAIQRVIDRHDILRTSLVWQGVPEPLQVVSRQARLAIEEIALDPSQGEAAAQLEARLDPRNTRFDLTQAPLIRAWVAEDARNGRWLLRILSHHLVLDHTTQDLLVEEAALIEAGRASELPAAVPFRNFVAQARLGVSEAEHEAFFTQMLGDIDEPTAPFGLLDVQGDGSEIEEAEHRVAPELAAAIRHHCRRLGVSAASLMHLAWSLVLARTTGREDVVFGTVLFGRMQGGEGADRVMGMFINTLPVRFSVDGSGVEAALRQTHARLAQLLRHEHAPLSLAQRCSAVEAPAPLFTALL
ncbi:condensation domain-containing protein, partial [Thauera sinica]